MNKTKLIAEIGINHNGDLNLAKKLIDSSVDAGFDFVKFQKRTPDLCVPEDQKNILKTGTPWGDITYIDYKYKVEFEQKEYEAINEYCKKKKIDWFASVWDIPSCDFMSNFTTIAKIPSALITDTDLIKYAREKFDKLMISTGMSTEEEISIAIKLCNPDIIFHTNSSYPSPVEELQLNYIKTLKHKYSDKEIGYSGHEYGLVTSFAAVAMGAVWVERHVTLDRTLWGSDQLASIEPAGMLKLVKGVRDIEKAFGATNPSGRKLFPSELSKRKSLRGN